MVVEKLLERSKLNKEKAEEEEAAEEAKAGKATADEDDPMDGTSDDKEDARSEDIGDGDDEEIESEDEEDTEVPVPTQTFLRMMKTSQIFSASMATLSSVVIWTPSTNFFCRIRSAPAGKIKLQQHSHRPPSFPDGPH